MPSLLVFLPKDVKRFSRESAHRQTDTHKHTHTQTGPILYPRPLTREGINTIWEAKAFSMVPNLQLKSFFQNFLCTDCLKAIYWWCILFTTWGVQPFPKWYWFGYWSKWICFEGIESMVFKLCGRILLTTGKFPWERSHKMSLHSKKKIFRLCILFYLHQCMNKMSISFKVRKIPTDKLLSLWTQFISLS